jgi:hypothetical protein
MMMIHDARGEIPNPGVLTSYVYPRPRGRPRTKTPEAETHRPSAVMVCAPTDHGILGKVCIGRGRPAVPFRSVLVAAAFSTIARMPEVTKIHGRLPSIWFKDDQQTVGFSADGLVKLNGLTPGLEALDVTGDRFYVTVLENVATEAEERRLEMCLSKWREVMGPIRHVVLTRHDVEERCADFFA